MVLLLFLCLAHAAKSAEFGNLTYTDNGNEITITGHLTAPTGTIVIPDRIDSKPVVGIGYRAFYNSPNLTGITVPKSLIVIGGEAFTYCSNMKFLAVSETGDPVTTGNGSIGAGAFANCYTLANVDISPRVLTLGSSAFFNCSALSAVSIPHAVTSIGSQAFRYCSSLTSLTIPPAVTSLGSRAFATCRGLTSMTIPASVTTISQEVFSECSALASINVEPLNANFSSLNGVLFNNDQTVLMGFPPAIGGAYEVPETVSSIGARAFYKCDRLVGVTLPASLEVISQEAFFTCNKLQFANFKGSAPIVGYNGFSLAAPDFAIYFLDGAAGFPIPPGDMVWNGYAAVNMGSNSTPATAWLLSRGLPANFDLQSDTNKDGVKLLMAWALNLDPHRDLSGQLPQPVISATQMHLSFYGGTSGVSYVVETTCDMLNWSSETVTLSDPDANQIRTASANLTGPCLFMRLAASN